MTDDAYSFKAASKKQHTFLTSKATIVIYGGSMGKFAPLCGDTY